MSSRHLTEFRSDTEDVTENVQRRGTDGKYAALERDKTPSALLYFGSSIECVVMLPELISVFDMGTDGMQL